MVVVIVVVVGLVLTHTNTLSLVIGFVLIVWLGKRFRTMLARVVTNYFQIKMFLKIGGVSICSFKIY